MLALRISAILLQDMLLTYHFILAAVDCACLWVLFRKPGPWRATALAAVWGGLALGVAAVCVRYAREDANFHHFALFCLLAAALFVHLPIVLVGVAVALRRHRWWLPTGAAVLAAAVLLVGFDAWIVEPTWLEITRLELVNGKLSRPIRVVVIADLQTDEFGEYERDVIRLAFAEKPDLLLWAGDYIQTTEFAKPGLRAKVNEFLKTIEYRPPLGSYAVLGNVDGWGWQEMFADTGVRAVSATTAFQLDGLRLTCLSLGDSFNPDYLPPDVVAAENEGSLHIVLGHAPSFAMGRTKADLMLAGHTHGGQVQVPLFGPLIANCELPRPWASGVTQRPNGGMLIVSRGIGLERGLAPRLRFWCRPELLVIDLKPAE